jgi:hypothetical protein
MTGQPAVTIGLRNFEGTTVAPVIPPKTRAPLGASHLDSIGEYQ